MGLTSIWHWLIVLLVVVLIFGTKKLSGMGKDIGSAVKNFKDAVRDPASEPSAAEQTPARVIDADSDKSGR